MNIAIPLTVFVCFLTACAAINDKPTYTLKSLQLHRYSAGDKLVYRIDGDRLGTEESQTFFGEATLSWDEASSVPDKDPNGALLPPILRESSNANVSIQTTLTQQRLISQASDNSYSVVGWAAPGERILWASTDNDAKASFGAKFLPGTLGESVKLTANYYLFDCSNATCTSVGHVTESLELEGKEQVTTAYAIFDTLKYIYTRSASSTNTELFNPGPNTIFETRWIFPELGTVKYIYQDSEGTRFRGSLARTTIKLADPS